jgi:N-acetylglucosamine-6-phosphate deacetylase
VSALVVAGGRDVHGARVDLLIDGDMVTEPAGGVVPGDLPRIDASGLVVVPGLLDLQVNGADGHDLTASPERLWDVGSALLRSGVTAFAPTVITSDPSSRDEALRVLRAGPPPGWVGARPLGWHFEGPMISERRKGAHPARWLAAPSLSLVRTWSRADGVLMATIAPELPGAIEVIEDLRSRGVLVAVGHTDAPAQQVEAAVAAGASCLTHLGNAMPPMLSREPGPVGVALGGTGLVAGVIVDGHHLDPLTLIAFWRALGPDRFLAVSDATAALGLGDGAQRLGEQDVVLDRGAVRLADGTLAGSATPISRCVELLRQTTGCSLAEAVATATSTPARLVGDDTRGHLGPGSRADLVLVDTTGDGLRIVDTLIGGQLTFERVL